MSLNLFNNCIRELLKDKEIFEINLDNIYQYLSSFKGFIYLLNNQTSLTIEKLLTEFSKLLALRKTTKNELIFQQGEAAHNFYIILKGNLKALKLRPYEYYMTKEEYISYLLYLRKNNQLEIIHQSKHYNNLIYPIPENFDNFVKNLAKGLSGDTYNDMENIKEKAEEVDAYILRQQQMNEENIINLSPEEYIQKFKVPEDVIDNTEKISNFINEKHDITNLKEIDNIKLLMKDRKKVIIPGYEEFIQLSTGDTFEDQAFENHSGLYQSSVISLDDEGYLGYINKKKYDLLIHESVEKRNKKIFGLLVYFSFLRVNNQFTFEKKYLTYINNKVFNFGQELFKEGGESENTFFLTEGEYELSTIKNIIEVNEMIIEYKKILRKLNPSNKIKQMYDLEEERKQNNDLILNKKFRSEEMNELIMKKRYIKINIIHNKDILGLSDVFAYDRDEVGAKKELLYYKKIKKKCLLTCICKNHNCHAFFIPNSIFNNIYYNEGYYNIISKNLEFKKICLIIERLKIYKKSIFDLVNKAQNKFSKKVKILKEISKLPKFNGNNFIKPKVYTKIMKELKESKESLEKISEKEKSMNIFKHNFNLINFKKNDDNKGNSFPMIVKQQKSTKSLKINLKKRNTNSININVSNSYNMYNKTYSSNFNNIFLHNFLYENLFYNYTINKNNQTTNTHNYFFSKSFKSKKPIIKNERYENPFYNTDYGNEDSKKSFKGVNTVNLSYKQKIIKPNKNLIGCYDPLAFDKFNSLFSLHFKRQTNDFNMSKTNFDK